MPRVTTVTEIRMHVSFLVFKVRRMLGIASCQCVRVFHELKCRLHFLFSNLGSTHDQDLLLELKRNR